MFPAIWFTCSIVGACISCCVASGKGRSVPRWVAFTFVAPLLAVLAITLARPLNRRAATPRRRARLELQGGY